MQCGPHRMRPECRRTGKQFSAAGSVEKLALALREIFLRRPELAPKMLAALEKEPFSSIPPANARLLKALIRMYGSSDRAFLNFYGPPGTIPTIPYYRILQGQVTADVPAYLPEARGKAHFHRAFPAPQT